MGVKATFFPRFKKVMAMIGSDREGERHAAADQAYRMCEENDVSFIEAVDGAFAGSGDELRQAEERIAELEDDNRKMADAVATMKEEFDKRIPDDAGKQLIEELWSYPQARLLALLAVFAVRLWLIMLFVNEVRVTGKFEHFVSWVIDAASIVNVCALAREWADAEFIKRGAGVFVLKAVILLIAFYGAVSSFHATGDAQMWFGSRVSHYNDAVPWLFAAAALTLPNIFPWLAEQLAHSKDQPFATLRSWFA